MPYSQFGKDIDIYQENAIKGDELSSEYMPTLTAFCSEILHRNVLPNIAFYGYSDIKLKVKKNRPTERNCFESENVHKTPRCLYGKCSVCQKNCILAGKLFEYNSCLTGNSKCIASIWAYQANSHVYLNFNYSLSC